MAAPFVQVDAVTVGYDGRPVLAGITFRVEGGDFLALVGPNGAGKTTLLRAVAGILRPLSGDVRRRAGLTIGYVPQERDLDPVFPLTALDVVRQGRIGRRGPWERFRPGDRALVERAMARAGVETLGPAQFAELSGGQKQRVLIARALATEPDLLLLDEPTSGTDPAAGLALMDLLRELHDAAGLAIVMATHNLGLIGNYARHVAVVDRERGLFRIGATAEILTDDVLTGLYGREIRVRTVNGWRTILAGGTA
jgi:ABC-type Mn2+/Zn2+ transport system ATPase subunit